MRTFIFIVAGLLLLAASVLLGRLFSATYPSAITAAITFYSGLWLVIASLNMWAGVAKAGYSVAEELPIFLLILAVPAAAALLLRSKFL